MERSSINKELKNELSVIPVVQTVLFPESDAEIGVNIAIGDAVNKSLSENDNYAIALSVKENFNSNNLNESSFYTTGTLIKVSDYAKKNNGYGYKVNVLERVEAFDFQISNNLILAKFSPKPDIIDLDAMNMTKMIEYMKEVSYEISKNFKGSEGYVKIIENIDSLTELMAYLSQFLNIPIPEKQSLFKEQSLRKRGVTFMDYLLQYKESISLQIEMSQKFSEEANKNYRKKFLREQLKAIQSELNEGGESKPKKKEYRELIETSGMPDSVLEVALEELDKYEAMGSNSQESHVIRNYLDLLVSLPWETKDNKEIDLIIARTILDSNHYGLEKVKDRIIQHLAVMKLKNDKQGSILLLVGPPGTGKTSLGKSIAEALGRKYVRSSLGGVRDEAEIRGHRRTYVGALPGRIIQGMKKAGEKNPVFVLDEVDKLVSAFHGDPASALLEVLDPEQNNTFSDHYLEVPYDLSDVFFVATANYIKDIPPPLLDRMEVIQISGYTGNEKFRIAKDHLISLVLEEHGLTEKQVKIDDDALKLIINDYTLEAGVRGLKKQLTSIARNISEKIVTANTKEPLQVTVELVEDILGAQIARHDVAQLDNPPGVVTGLAWTPVGGDILFVEGTFMPGKGSMTLTGQLGDVMKESAKISLSLVRSRLAYNLPNFDFSKKDLHIHVPSGSIPKDGPSAGVALFTAISSLVMGRKIDPKLAMTGEITLRGSVLPVGGIKEKVLAAHRAGIKKIILPKENKKDLKDVPDDVKNDLKFVSVETIEDLISETLGIELPKQEILLENFSEKEFSNVT